MVPYIYSISSLAHLLNTLELMRNNRDADSYNKLLVSLDDLVRKSREEYFRSLASPLIDASVDDGLPF